MPSGRFYTHDLSSDGNVKSLPQCIEHLCTVHLRKNVSTKPTYSKPKTSVQTYLKPVKRAAFDALFKKKQCGSDVFPGALLSSKEWTEENIVHAVTYRMRTAQRRFHDADRLEELAEKLLNDGDGNSPILRFLLCLADVKDYPVKHCDFFKRRSAPTRYEIRKIAKTKGQLFAGDYPYDFFNSTYTVFLPWHSQKMDIEQPLMYPEKQKDADHDLLHAKKYSNPDFSVYKNSKSLFGLQSEFFADKGLTDSPYEIDSQTRLYGGLRHSRTFDLDVKLSYPKITGPIDMMASISTSITSIDEGFVSPSTSVEFSDSEAEESPRKTEQSHTASLLPYHGYRSPDYDLNLWKDCLVVQKSSHRTWETLGLPAGSTQREYYLTEAGAKVFDEIWQQRAKIICRLSTFLSESPFSVPKWTEVGQTKLIKHAALVTMGVASETFQFNGLAQMFIPRKNLFFSGVDPEAVHSLLSEFSEWGTCCWRLLHFSNLSVSTLQWHQPAISFFQPRTQHDEIEEKGAIFKAFTDAIRRYLHEYQHQILSLNLQNLTLQKLAIKIRKAGAQIRYICQLCKCGEPDLPPPSLDAVKDFPSGVALLSYLYAEAVHCPEPNHYLALLYLLRKSCLPYLQFVKDWVFRGNCWDANGEFMLRVNADYGGARLDRQRWLKYVEPANLDDPSSCVPSFLSSMAKDIYTCGKTVALLQFVSPEHFLVVDGVDTPELEITFSKRKLQAIENNWKRHDLKMTQFETERTTHWIKKEEELKAAAHKVALMVRKAAKQEFIKIQDAIKEERKERNEIKRKEFERLKKQAEEDAERRALAIRTEKEEDVKREAQVHEKEIVKQAEENRILQEEKEKIISYYEELNIEAEKRILKASWINRRNRLQTKRNNFAANDKRMWQHEMDKSNATADIKIIPSQNEEKSFEEMLDTSVSGDVFQSPADKTSTQPDLLREFLNATLSPQKIEQLQTPKSETDTESALRTIGSGEFFSGGVEKGCTERPHIAPGIHHVSEQTLDREIAEVKVHRKMIPGRSTHDSNLPLGQDTPLLTTNLQTMSDDGVMKSSVSEAFFGASPTPGAPISITRVVDGKNVSESNIADLMGVSGAAPGVGEERSIYTRKSVPGKHVSVTTLATEKSSIPLQIRTMQTSRVSDSNMGSIMQEDTASEIATKTFKKIVPGQSVSMSTVGQLLTPTYPGASPKLTPKAPKQDSVMSEILYGSPVGHAPPSQSITTGRGKSTPTIPNPSDSTMQALIYGNDHETKITRRQNMPDDKSTPIIPNPSDSTVQDLLYGDENNKMQVFGKKMIEGRNISESCVGDLMKLNAGTGEPLPNTEVNHLRKFALANRAHRAHHSQSVMQDLVYYDDSDRWSFQKESKSRVAVLKAAILKPAVNQVKRHPSYSTLQLLMYPKPVIKERDKEMPKPMEETFHLQLPAISGYSDTFEPKVSQDSATKDDDVSKINPVDLVGNVTGKSLENEFEDSTSSHDWRADIDAVDMHALPVLLSHCVVRPIMQQVALANRCVINYFMVDMEMMRHFEMLRHFCFMEDGEFSQILSTQLFEKMHSGCRPIELLNPVVLGSLITQAVQGSAQRNSPHVKKLTFSVQHLPHAFSTNDPGSLDCFTLKYNAGWPCNIVVTESNQQKYGQVFVFLLKLKHVMWALHDVVSKLSSMESSSTNLSKSELRQLHLYRHEMQNFVKVMQGYVSTQVVHVCWHEFQDSLKTAICLEDLHSLHVEYLRKCIYRCLLTKNTSVIMNVIIDVFKVILRFWTQLSSRSVSFTKLVETYANFRKFSQFLFKVVSKLVECGYQPHLEDFLLRLNYNGFYRQ